MGSVYRKNTDRLDIIIEENCRRITILQRWRYIYLNKGNTSIWMESEKRTYPNKLNEMIDASWSKSFSLKVYGTSEFAKRNKQKKWTVDFELDSVNYDGHWYVYLTKVPENYYKTSSVLWHTRQVVLNTPDFEAEKSRLGHTQTTVLHEFGHTIGNTSSLFQYQGDEYKKTSPYFSDKESIMNLGNEIRERHFSYLLDNLNDMIPSTKLRLY